MGLSDQAPPPGRPTPGPVTSVPAPRAYVDDGRLYLPEGGAIPAACIRCGAPTTQVLVRPVAHGQRVKQIPLPHCPTHLETTKSSERLVKVGIGVAVVGLLISTALVSLSIAAAGVGAVISAVSLGGVLAKAAIDGGPGLTWEQGADGIFVSGLSQGFLAAVDAAEHATRAPVPAPPRPEDLPTPAGTKRIAVFSVRGALAYGPQLRQLTSTLPTRPGRWHVLLQGELGMGSTYLLHEAVLATMSEHPPQRLATIGGVRGVVFFVDAEHVEDPETVRDLEVGEDTAWGHAAQTGGNGSFVLHGAQDDEGRAVYVFFEH